MHRAQHVTTGSRALFAAFAVFVLYVAAGKFGLQFAFLHDSATAVWAPTGIALAALLLYGLRLWPAILAGAFIVNLTTSGTLSSSLGIAIGNTLEAVVGAWLGNRFAGGRRAIDRAQDLFKLAFLAGVLATALSAVFGLGTLVLTDLADRRQLTSIFITWWTGDAVGAWLFAPLLLFWAADSRLRWSPAQAAEAALFAVVLTIVALLAFGGWTPVSRSGVPLEFACMPVLLWAAFRLGPREAITAACALSVAAVGGTTAGHGPFARTSPNEGLILLQIFMGVIALTTAAVGALVVDQRRAQERARHFREELEARVEKRTAELAASEERLLEAQRVAHIGSWEWDVATDRVWWSDELFRIYGLEVGTNVGGYLEFLERVHLEDRAKVQATIERAGVDKLPFELEHRIVRPDGEVRTLHARGQVVIDRHGRLERMLGTGLDMTEWSRLEAERVELFREQTVLREAERASRMKDEFLATLSHELRTPLNAILGWLQILRAGSASVPLDRAVEVMNRNAVSLRRLIEDMLDVSAIISGKLELRRRSIDIGELIRTTVESFGPAAAAKGVTLTGEPVADVLPVMADPERLQQIFSNLVGNAVKFTGSGGIVSLTAEKTPDHVVLRIADTGVGIAPDALPHIFEAFSQGDSSTTRPHGGLGLGLAIADRLVALHGGTLTAASPGLGRGATFTVTLPLHATPSVAVELDPIGSSAESLPPGLSVLIVDDDADSRELLRSLLEPSGAHIRTAASSPAALAICRDAHPDLLLVDLAMPGEDGFSFLASARGIGVRAAAIAVTAHAGSSHRRRALEAGFDAYLSKPIVVSELLKAASSVLLHRTG
jgi:signal transduction histidine kinase/integral membrane sensor domain MASE1/CheY-like chemotaxis protein